MKINNANKLLTLNAQIPVCAHPVYAKVCVCVSCWGVIKTGRGASATT